MSSLSISSLIPITGVHRRRSPAIHAGPRDNRGKLQRGRSLSSESLLAIQSLKLAQNRPNFDAVMSQNLSRLLKSDLLAALAELLRQNQYKIALKALAFARDEPWYKSPDFPLYANIITTLFRCGAPKEEIDAVVGELIEENGNWGFKGAVRVVRSLLAVERGDLAMGIYREMRRRGWEGEEEVFRVLGNGLRRLGFVDLAEEVRRDFTIWDEGGFVSVENEKERVCV